MCREIYLASTDPLPVIEWNANDPGFAVQEVQEQSKQQFVRRFLNEPYIYEIDSYMGCGCGFDYGEWFREDETAAYEANVRDVRSLLSYLRDQATHADLVLFLWDWSGKNWEWALENPLELASNPLGLDPNQALGDEFEFTDNCIYRVLSPLQIGDKASPLI